MPTRRIPLVHFAGEFGDVDEYFSNYTGADLANRNWWAPWGLGLERAALHAGKHGKELKELPRQLPHARAGRGARSACWTRPPRSAARTATASASERGP